MHQRGGSVPVPDRGEDNRAVPGWHADRREFREPALGSSPGEPAGNEALGDYQGQAHSLLEPAGYARYSFKLQKLLFRVPLLDQSEDYDSVGG